MTKILLQGGNVLDPAHGSLLLRHDVLIENDRIIDVSSTPIDAPDAKRIDVSGKTVMPGLIDCHVHVLASLANLGANALQPGSLTSIRALPIVEAMLNRGFTTVRDAGGADWGLAQAIAIGLVPGPRIFPSGKALSQTGGHGDFRPRSDVLEPCSCAFRAGAIARVADGVDAVRLAAREEIQKGATQIKIMASGGVASPTDPIGNTQYSEDEIRAIVAEAEAAQTYVMAHAYTGRAISRAVRCGVRTIEHGNLVDADAARIMREHGAFVVPTLVTYDSLARDGARLGLPADSVAKIESVRQAGRDSLKIYAEHGVQMGFGSDLLGEMHQDQSQEFAVRAGARADLIVVDGNPLDDIHLLAGQGEHLSLVMQGGYLHRSSI